MLGSDDADLLFEQALAGNESGVADLFEHYRPRLKRLVLLRMHPQLNARVDASDVLQETFIEMARRLPAYAQDRRMSFFLWLRWLTTERLHQLHRKHLGAGRSRGCPTPFGRLEKKARGLDGAAGGV